jgi:hypothetical protein
MPFVEVGIERFHDLIAVAGRFLKVRAVQDLHLSPMEFDLATLLQVPSRGGDCSTLNA